jgi:hypothetical protein
LTLPSYCPSMPLRAHLSAAPARELRLSDIKLIIAVSISNDFIMAPRSRFWDALKEDRHVPRKCSKTMSPARQGRQGSSRDVKPPQKLLKMFRPQKFRKSLLIRR